MLVLSITCCIAVALALHYGIEKPFMKMREQFLNPATRSQRKMEVAFIKAKT